VRIAKITSVWVASDSTNPQHDAEGRDIKQRADWPEKQHEPADETHIPARRAGELLGIGAVGGDGQLAGVIDQVVEQVQRRQHRQERQEERGARSAEHVPEVAGRPHEHVLHGVGEYPPTLHDPVG
jgi:hypothetical protein